MLLKQWPALMRWYGAMPWMADQFTDDELLEMIRQLPRTREET